ncbi:hypothetical protein [Rhodococcus sp. O3]|uniref:hypothetical protein n=1 Tax=Rhodococcus sp. O3 TaxID=3404919 RepID=UPI003B66FFAA
MPETPATLSPAAVSEHAAPTTLRRRRPHSPTRIADRGARKYHVQPNAAAPSRDVDWVRRSLMTCDFLAGVQSLDPGDRKLVAFAVEWAPFGGAGPEELFITFGVRRNRFLHLLQAAMMTRPTDSVRLRTTKSALRDELLSAWRGSTPGPSRASAPQPRPRPAPGR